ncbi:CLUMA_CG001089, isoform A [Clunio marinus]|uniref:CLUMA_CG001089, isoform A n=1 Tax=Clunio marinus TaxID=568069 RepID=A0A1J1HGZ3_9DIPT|nr:CLUMA_CG001089, isoform A [Clunio marinus]
MIELNGHFYISISGTASKKNLSWHGTNGSMCQSIELRFPFIWELKLSKSLIDGAEQKVPFHVLFLVNDINQQCLFIKVNISENKYLTSLFKKSSMHLLLSVILNEILSR